MKAKLIFAFCFCMALGAMLFGQSAPTIDVTDPNSTAQLTDFVYAFLVVVGGYASHRFPIINNIKDTGWRVAATGIAIALAFLGFGWSSALKLLLTFCTSTTFYELLLSNVGNLKTKQLNPAKASYNG